MKQPSYTSIATRPGSPRPLALLLACWIAATTLVTARPPNVLLIYSDDQGSVDVGCYGSDDLLTPHLDKLAERGTRFTQMYSPSAICSASRAGLMTGRFPYRAGVPSNVSSKQGTPGMPASEVTIAEMLGAAGYTTGHIGKWHLGYTPATMPNGQGFDHSFGHMGGCIDNYSHFFYWNGPNRHDLWRNGEEIWQDGTYFGDLMVDELNRFIDTNQSKPWFAYWAINFPHYPLQGKAHWRKRYQGLESPRDMYNAFVSTMDEMIGEVLAKIESLGLTDNTLVIFQSDHGHSTEERTFRGGGNAGPYRGAKGCLFEGGIRVPSIVSLPARLPKGAVRGQMATGCDWLPTIAEICGVPKPDQHLDGTSILKVIESSDSPSPHAEFYWHLGSGKNAQWVVRSGDWKLLGNPRDSSGKGALGPKNKLFLTNLATDIAESKNLADDHPEIVEKLAKKRKAFLTSIEDSQGAAP